LEDYYHKFYNKLEQRTKKLSDDNHKALYELLRWKEKVLTNWENIEIVNVNLYEANDHTYYLGEKTTLWVDLRLGVLKPDDIKVEICFIHTNGQNELLSKWQFLFVKQENGVTHYECDLEPDYAGSWRCGVRIMPSHPLLPHDFDFNLVKWM
jgi:starch phosphorylase